MKIGLELLGCIAGVLTTFSYVPQIIRVYKNADISGLSGTFLLLLAAGLVLWIIYGYGKKSLSIGLFSAISLAFIVTILVKYYMVKNSEKDEEKIKYGM